ncbi:uncharacterized protein LOC105697221 [Orussus abietinus]|uniref:uncharacterized protein LOC105697221 n=1 Tax=Orussus abietinus TaxID=222816 RepID=UPI000625B227|nr:uncharacterized protein LOC105697221 [Orussus abietinus]
MAPIKRHHASPSSRSHQDAEDVDEHPEDRRGRHDALHRVDHRRHDHMGPLDARKPCTMRAGTWGAGRRSGRTSIQKRCYSCRDGRDCCKADCGEERLRARKYIRKALSFGVDSGYLIPADSACRVLRVSSALASYKDQKAMERGFDTALARSHRREGSPVKFQDYEVQDRRKGRKGRRRRRSRSRSKRRRGRGRKRSSSRGARRVGRVRAQRPKDPPHATAEEEPEEPDRGREDDDDEEYGLEKEQRAEEERKRAEAEPRKEAKPLAPEPPDASGGTKRDEDVSDFSADERYSDDEGPPERA